jgi:putative DNA methylase
MRLLIVPLCHTELLGAGLSSDYARALASIAAAFLVRRLRYATRGCRIRPHGNGAGTAQNRVQAGDLFSSEASLLFQFDFLEAGPGKGPGTWESVCATGLKPLETHVSGLRGRPARSR